MKYSKVVIKRIVSPDGKIIAEAKSSVSVSGNGENKIDQVVEVSTDGNSYSSSSSSSSSSK